MGRWACCTSSSPHDRSCACWISSPLSASQVKSVVVGGILVPRGVLSTDQLRVGPPIWKTARGREGKATRPPIAISVGRDPPGPDDIGCSFSLPLFLDLCVGASGPLKQVTAHPPPTPLSFSPPRRVQRPAGAAEQESPP